MSNIRDFLYKDLKIKEKPPKNSEANILIFLEENYIKLYDECF